MLPHFPLLFLAANLLHKEAFPLVTQSHFLTGVTTIARLQEPCPRSLFSFHLPPARGTVELEPQCCPCDFGLPDVVMADRAVRLPIVLPIMLPLFMLKLFVPLEGTQNVRHSRP